MATTKTSLARKQLPEGTFLEENQWSLMASVFAMYPISYTFLNNSIYYDSFKEEKSAIWDKNLNTKYKSPKEQKIDGFLCFQAMEVVQKSMLLLHLKSPAPVKVGKLKKRKTFDDDDSFTYFKDLAVEKLGRTKGRCVLIDPRRRNINYILCKKQLR
ncbi:uncharacterized protein EV154DRAFT_487061 [Mucor mucedo]|uniref:uncharacterized protein n=1 Tax=Mucor mucedo TaxID=29922 RepID=UPI00221EEF9D|nr:uncharacterized protein EV154DRAFT_487061 [Mucor mucedo]KAI7873859.1 hypothetical protein EV154DRAFT_487061 [Mucor mucedo]